MLDYLNKVNGISDKDKGKINTAIDKQRTKIYLLDEELGKSIIEVIALKTENKKLKDMCKRAECLDSKELDKIKPDGFFQKLFSKYKIYKQRKRYEYLQHMKEVDRVMSNLR